MRRWNNVRYSLEGQFVAEQDDVKNSKMLKYVQMNKEDAFIPLLSCHSFPKPSPQTQQYQNYNQIKLFMLQNGVEPVDVLRKRISPVVATVALVMLLLLHIS